jgi:DNA-binding LacI/PurR family transcriptional regulator
MKISDVAQALGVSSGTVSRAITGNGRIADKTRQRILRYMEEQDFHPNASAQSLSTQQTFTLAYTVPAGPEFTAIPFFLECLLGVQRRASQEAYDTLVVKADLASVRRVVTRRKVDAVIVSRNTADDRVLDYLSRAGLPCVLTGTTDVPGIVQVDHDHQAACREFTATVWHRLGGRPGAIMGPRSYAVNQARAAGFEQAVAAAGGQGLIEWDAETIGQVKAAFDRLTGAGVRYLFCGDDVVANLLLPQLRGASGSGQAMAADVAVASFYDSDRLARDFPEVPALRFDAAGLGERAADLTLRLLAGEEVTSEHLRHDIRLSAPPARAAQPAAQTAPPAQPARPAREGQTVGA